MPIHLSTEIANSFPLLLLLGMLAACIGFTCSVASLVWLRIPTGSGKRTNVLAKLPVVGGVLTFASALLWFGVTALHLLAWQLRLVEESTNQLHLLSYLSSFVAIQLGWQLWNRAGSGNWAGGSRMMMQMAQVGGLVCCWQLYPAGNEDQFVLAPPGKLVAIQTAHTDRGTPIHLYDRATEPGEISKFFRATQEHLSGVSRFAMFRADPKVEVNCHGWVFTGLHIIKCEDVPAILRDNGYELITDPKLNDLVVYSDASGTVLHTGVVCGFLLGETALIESKWGVAGRYVHLVDEQPYSKCYSFYRSPREGHRLNYCETPTENLANHRNDQLSPKANSLPETMSLPETTSSDAETRLSAWSVAIASDIAPR